MPVPVIWFAVAVALLIAELATTTFYAIFLALGAAAAGIVALAIPDLPIWLQAVVAVAVAVAGVVIVRPILGRKMQGRGVGAVGPGVHGGFVGQRALTLDVVGDQLHPGHVRLAGETWLAFMDAVASIPPGLPVEVVAVRGTSLLVRLVNADPHPSPEG